MNKKIKILLYGFLTWLIPFAAAFLFYTKDKSIMIVAGSAAGALLLIPYFRKIERNYLREGITVGLA